MFLNYEESKEKTKDLGLKFPISIHDVEQLSDLPQMEEKVDYKPPLKKKTTSVVVELGKRANKNSGNKLF